MNEENISLAEAIARYLSTVPATDRQEYQKWLNRFKKWCGEDTPLNKLKAYDHVEKYGNQVLESSSGGNDVNLEPVKTFLAYAKKTKLI
ncbi:MAG: hypothetical protein NTV30_05835, partial [Chloroflexi bacterium]|nr:hypothetical protein [Chloroflexota bacterium]